MPKASASPERRTVGFPAQLATGPGLYAVSFDGRPDRGAVVVLDVPPTAARAMWVLQELAGETFRFTFYPLGSDAEGLVPDPASFCGQGLDPGRRRDLQGHALQVEAELLRRQGALQREAIDGQFRLRLQVGHEFRAAVRELSRWTQTTFWVEVELA